MPRFTRHHCSSGDQQCIAKEETCTAQKEAILSIPAYVDKCEVFLVPLALSWSFDWLLWVLMSSSNRQAAIY